MYNRCDNKASYIISAVDTAAGSIPVVSTKLSPLDAFGTIRVRSGIRRSKYRVAPGLYAVGKPDASSPVLVTANYKLSFDALRCRLRSIDAWILVLDTNGVNVWCAAGKGTFGTIELIKRMYLTSLKDIVSHRTLILPQLGAVGVAAHEVAKKTGFKVVYGPVRSEDIPEFLKANMQATKEMRKVRFNMIDRLVVTPMEIMASLKPLCIIAFILLLVNFIGSFSTPIWDVVKLSLLNLLAYIGAFLTGSLVVPMLLPWIPVRSFTHKGLLLGFIWAATVFMYPEFFGMQSFNIALRLGHIIITIIISAYLSLNFTGSTTYTSFSGVRKEVKLAAIPMILATAVSILLLISGKVLQFLSMR